MITTDSSYRIEMEEIFLEIRNQSKEMYINRYVDIPEIAIIQLQLLNLFLYNASISKNLRKSYCVASGLIQIGIDLHESITNNKEIRKLKIKNRQLSILAGDYFSSIYYLLLSKVNLVGGINKLATGITEINTAKMKLYMASSGKEFKSVEEILELLKIRESSLYVQLLNESNSYENKEKWKFLIENIILLNFMSNELQSEKIDTNTLSYFLLRFYVSNEERNKILLTAKSSEDNIQLKMLYHKYNIKNKIEDIIIKVNNNINNKISSLDDQFIKKELLNLLNHTNISQTC